MRKFLIIAVLLQLVWGLVPTASKIVIDEIPVELYIAIRWSISGGIFAIYLTLTKGWRQLSLVDVGRVSLLGILGYGAASIGTLYGLKIGGVANFALMSSLGPVITSVLSIWLLRERPTSMFYFALPGVVGGLILLMIGKYQVSSFAIAGASAAFIMGGYSMEALVFVFSKKLRGRVSSTQYLAIAQMATAILMWLLQITVFHQSAEIRALTIRGLIAAAFVSVVACVFCYSILYWLLHHLDGHRLALFDSIHVLSATTFGYFYFHDPLQPMMLVGGAFILFGIILGNWPATEKPQNLEPHP